MLDWQQKVGAGSLVLVVAAMAAMAQTAPSSTLSPFVPDDLKRPIFDTATPEYDTEPEHEKTANALAAEVDGRPVTLAEVGDAIADLPAGVQNLPFADLFPIVRDQLVRQQALVIRAQHLSLDEDPVVRRRVRVASDRVVASALLEKEAGQSITEASLLARYNKDIAGQPGPEEAHIRVIMTATEAEAMAIITELHDGADFAVVARRSSQDATAPAGGDAGFVARDGLTPEVGAVVFAMPTGQMTAFPVHSAGGWFVLKVEERRQGAIPSFAAAREKLHQTMLREGSADVVAASLKSVTVREYDIDGKELEVAAGQ